MSHEWVVCPKGKGRLIENGKPERAITTFPANSVGEVKGRGGGTVTVWLIGRNETWLVPASDTKLVDVAKTGDEHSKKICNICHCLYSVEMFAKNQKKGNRRPTCKRCRTDIDKRPPKSRQAKQIEKQKPSTGEPFRCPICRKRSIALVTAKIVADHDHNTGNIRDFICDSCNTGLGRFKNGEDYLQNAIEYLKERDALKATE